MLPGRLCVARIRKNTAKIAKAHNHSGTPRKTRIVAVTGAPLVVGVACPRRPLRSQATPLAGLRYGAAARVTDAYGGGSASRLLGRLCGWGVRPLQLKLELGLVPVDLELELPLDLLSHGETDRAAVHLQL